MCICMLEEPRGRQFATSALHRGDVITVISCIDAVNVNTQPWLPVASGNCLQVSYQESHVCTQNLQARTIESAL